MTPDEVWRYNVSGPDLLALLEAVEDGADPHDTLLGFHEACPTLTESENGRWKALRTLLLPIGTVFGSVLAAVAAQMLLRRSE